MHIPIEYKRGFVKFINCKIDLSQKTLIPRIETTYWVKQSIKKLLNTKNAKLNILDIFSGSGCIGIDILKNIKFSYVDFIDLDKKAIKQIKINLALNQISLNRFNIFHSNLFNKLKKQKYDYIFANPPYVAKEKLDQVQESVKKYEPKLAWYGGKNGMYTIKKFLKNAQTFLINRGTIFMEIDPFQKNEITILCKKLNYSSWIFHQDQFQKIRFVEINT